MSQMKSVLFSLISFVAIKFHIIDEFSVDTQTSLLCLRAVVASSLPVILLILPGGLGGSAPSCLWAKHSPQGLPGMAFMKRASDSKRYYFAMRTGGAVHGEYQLRCILYQKEE